MGKTPTEPEALRAEIAQTRAELGETVEALAAKADVKARAHEAVDDVKARVHDTADEVRERVQETADDVRERMHGAVDTMAYQVGKQREKVAALSPRARTTIVAALAGLAALLVILKVRRGRRR